VRTPPPGVSGGKGIAKEAEGVGPGHGRTVPVPPLSMRENSCICRNGFLVSSQVNLRAVDRDNGAVRLANQRQHTRTHTHTHTQTHQCVTKPPPAHRPTASPPHAHASPSNGARELGHGNVAVP
jgi:hypothetical protein